MLLLLRYTYMCKYFQLRRSQPIANHLDLAMARQRRTPLSIFGSFWPNSKRTSLAGRTMATSPWCRRIKNITEDQLWTSLGDREKYEHWKSQKNPSTLTCSLGLVFRYVSYLKITVCLALCGSNAIFWETSVPPIDFSLAPTTLTAHCINDVRTSSNASSEPEPAVPSNCKRLCHLLSLSHTRHGCCTTSSIHKLNQETTCSTQPRRSEQAGKERINGLTNSNHNSTCFSSAYRITCLHREVCNIDMLNVLWHVNYAISERNLYI